MKEALVSVLTGLQSLGSDDVNERPLDRLHAMAAAKNYTAGEEAVLTSLGRDLIAFKFAHRVDSRDQAIKNLADALGWASFKLGLHGKNRKRIASWAVQEWVIDFCPSCSGKCEVPMHLEQSIEGRQPMKQCPTCRGTGKRRYSDEERKEALGDLNRLERGLFVAHGVIGWAEAAAVRSANHLLERWPVTT